MAGIEITLKQLEKWLQKAWCRETATDGVWDREVPSYNQCAVTALVVQDFLGGKLLRVQLVSGRSHYYNVLKSGLVIDLTATQFTVYPDPSLKHPAPVIRRREYVLSYPDTVRRYALLLSRVARQMEPERFSLRRWWGS